jgi:hypothetical protein
MIPKQAAALRALEEVHDGMLLGLGTGSTARYFIDGLGERVRAGLRVTAVATSRASAEQAVGYGIELVESVAREIDLTVDGADEIDPDLNLVKGRGGALLREKVVAASSARMIVIATADKLVAELGQGPLPVEVLPQLHPRLPVHAAPGRGGAGGCAPGPPWGPRPRALPGTCHRSPGRRRGRHGPGAPAGPQPGFLAALLGRAGAAASGAPLLASAASLSAMPFIAPVDPSIFWAL